MGNDIRSEVVIVNEKIQSLLKEFTTKERKKILRRAARPLRAAARKGVKDAKKPVKRYSTPKVINSLRAPKGKGRVAAIYHPGNLRRSIKILNFRRAKTAVFVGPKVGAQGAAQFGKPGQKTDGYYGQMVEFGTKQSSPNPFMRPAFTKTKGQVVAIITEQVNKKIKEFKRRKQL